MVVNYSPVIEAHRGNSADCPENTLAAFRSAVSRGVSHIELDVHPCRDGAWVVMHDPTVDRTTDGRGEIASLTAAVIAGLDAGSWKGLEFAGEPVPGLEAVLAFAASRSALLNIEVKAFRTAAAAEALAGLLSRPEYRPAVEVVSSFDVKALLALRAAAPELAMGMLGSGPAALEQALACGFEWVHVHYGRASRDLVTAAHAAGIRVMVWTLDRPDQYMRFRRMGVDKICTNRPAVMLRAARAYADGR